MYNICRDVHLVSAAAGERNEILMLSVLDYLSLDIPHLACF